MTQNNKKFDLTALQKAAHDIRSGALLGVYNAASGHPGGSLSCADILAYLYFYKLNIDPKNPKDQDRDRFVLSKGHAAPALYAALAYRGFFPVDELGGLRQIGSFLQGHPDMKGTPGVDMTTGSLGIGFSAACGMALAAKKTGGLTPSPPLEEGGNTHAGYRVYCICGDGELQEGAVWEAAMFAAHYKLDNLTLYVDANGLQIDGRTSEIMGVEHIDRRFAAFGWDVRRINGHDIDAIHTATSEAETIIGMPHVIVCDTVKGRGVSYMEGNVNWHGAAPKEDEYKRAVEELTTATNRE